MNTEEADTLRAQRCLDLIQREFPTSSSGDLVGLRVLDLACRTGWISKIIADAGAEVVGIEGRQSNLDQAHQSTRRPIEYICADVRTVTRHIYGQFDVVLNLGLLYHLDAESAFRLLNNLVPMTRGLMILDTHISLSSGENEDVTLNGQLYHGHTYREPETPWSSVGNDNSFWFTPNSLVGLVLEAGFKGITALDSYVPAYEGESPDRMWFTVDGIVQ